MYSVNHMEQHSLGNNIEIQMRLQQNSWPNRLTAANLCSEIHCPTVRANSYKFMKNMKGAAANWYNDLTNLLATVKCLGPSTVSLLCLQMTAIGQN